VNNFIDNLKGLGKKRLVLMGSTALGMTAALVIGLSVAMAPQYRPLVMDATASDASQMMTELENAGFEPKISADGTVISLPEQDVARARMALAQAGLPPEGNVGWELFDENSGLGMNSFEQQINRLRALEGELARSIETIDNVDTARVHLVLPDREAFSQERPDPSASIVVHARRGSQLTKSQAMSIRSLVAAAVPRLSPDRVTILDGTGQALLTEEDLTEGSGLNSVRTQIEERLRKNVETILAAHVGAENVRVRVTADLDNSREVVVREAFDPEQQVERSTITQSDQSETSDGSSNSVDVANNMPGLDTGANGSGGRTSRNSSSRDEVVYEIGNTRSEVTREPGSVKRITVAVVVNGITDEDGVYSERSPEDIKRLTLLAQTAAGIDPDRGDTVTVENLQFASSNSMLAGRDGSRLVDLFAMNFGTILRSLSAVGIFALLMLFGVRPLLRHLFDGTKEAPQAEVVTDHDKPAEAEEATASDADEDANISDEASGDEIDDDLQDVIAIASVSGKVMRHHIDTLNKIADKDPDATLRTIRSWINQKG
jgi:flagellar M-ring protein FliF